MKIRRKNPKNPSLPVTLIVSGGLALTSIVLVSIVMQSRRNAAIDLCGRIGSLGT